MLDHGVEDAVFIDAFGYLGCDFGARDGVLGDTDISIGVHNLFNEKGPTIASGIAFSNGPVSYGDPRLRRFTPAVHKHL